MVTSVLQATILCLYNEVDELTVGQIAEKTQIPKAVMGRHLVSLCNPKNGRILLKQNMKKVNFNDLEEIIKVNLNIK